MGRQAAEAFRSRIVGEGTEPPDQLLANPLNWRRHPREQHEALEGMLRAVGWVQRVIVNRRTGHIVDGHLRVELALRRAEPAVPVLYVDLTEDEEKIVLAAIDPIGGLAETDDAALDALLEGLESGDAALDAFLDTLRTDDVGLPAEDGGSLAEQFLVPPFSVLNAREGWWQDRKRTWLALGIESETGRDDNLLGFSSAAASFAGYRGQQATETMSQGTSVFDPVLCEVAYRWFSPPGGAVLDPFAGGSVRGVVACRLGRRYVGIELRAEQIAANRRQAESIFRGADVAPEWIEGDSRDLDRACPGLAADFVFSCPPYADLEVYSDDPRDLSTLDYPAFRAAYREIIGKACALLQQDRFACFVVGEVRDKAGNYLDFVGDTVQAFRDAGLHFYNEAILVTAVGSLPIRAGRQFAAGRKLGKTHQNVLVFVKGDGKRAALACGQVEVAGIEEEADA